jgi:hypothetical protein
MPISFLELVPKQPKATVAIEAADGEVAQFEIKGISLAELADIGRKYPSFARVIEGGAGLLTASEALPAIIAAGLGHHGDAQYERQAAALPSGIVIAVAGEVVRLTFPSDRPPIALAEAGTEPALEDGAVNGVQPAAILPAQLNS